MNYVSGDIYNVERLDDRTLGFFIADAVGHGVPAALLTMVLSHSLTTTEPGLDGEARRVITPSRVLSALNDRLCLARSINGRFATAVYGTIDVPTRRVKLCGAGHPPPILSSRTGSRMIETDGPLLGVFPEATFAEVEFRIEDNETLLLYTDGLEASFNNLSRSGASREANNKYLKRVSDLFLSSETDLESEIDDLSHLLDEQAGSLHQPDDVTALAIRAAAVQVVEPLRAAA